MRKLVAVIGVLLIVLGLSGCDMIMVGDDGIIVEFGIPEASLNNIITTNARQNAGQDDAGPLERVTGIDLIEPDIIRVFGETTQDGNPVSGSYDVRVSAESGALMLSIPAIDVPGLSLDDPRVVRANAELTKAFSDQITSEQGQGVIRSATIEDGELQLRLEISTEMDSPGG